MLHDHPLLIIGTLLVLAYVLHARLVDQRKCKRCSGSGILRSRFIKAHRACPMCSGRGWRYRSISMLLWGKRH